MWSDQNDKDFKKAADAWQTPFEEKSWDKMKVLLDEHLPAKKKRRFFFWLPLGLAAGLIGWLVYTNTGEKREPSSISAVKEQPAPILSNKKTRPEPVTQEVQNNVGDKKENTITGQRSNKDAELTPAPSENTILKNAVLPRSERPAARSKSEELKNDTRFQQAVPLADVKKDEPAAAEADSKNKVTITTPADAEIISPDKSITVSVPDKPDMSVATDTALIKTDSVATTTLPADQKKQKGKSNELLLLVSAGPEISYTSTAKMGRVKLQTGLGLAYTFAGRWRVSTGFYVARKVYTADSADYYPPPNFWNYYPNLQYTDASCLVYEIPLSVTYSFSSGEKHDLFAAAGISSVIMKEETYNYAYKNAGGDLQHRERTISNENNHLFSTLQFSGGYSYHVSRRFSLMAEPYIKLPISGIGYGKVKLKSAGILFTAGFRPFGK